MPKQTVQQLSPSRSLDENIQDWGIVRLGAAKMLFAAGESYDSICRIMGCSMAQLVTSVPNPPKTVCLAEYDAIQVLAIFKGEYVLTDQELIRDIYNPDETIRIKTRTHDSGIKTIMRDDLRAYLRKKALRSLGYRDEGVNHIP